MGYDLNNANQHFGFSVFAWSFVLDLAKEFGWQPMGTVLSETTAKIYLDEEERSNEETIQETIRSWEGNYDGNNYQSVVDKDALNLANALDNALKVIPDKRNPAYNTLLSLTDDTTGLNYLKMVFRGIESIYPGSPVDYFSGIENKKYLKEFIQFCKCGSFSIH